MKKPLVMTITILLLASAALFAQDDWKAENRKKIIKLTEQIETDSSNYSLFHDRSFAYYLAEEYDNMMNDADQMIKLQPDNVYGYLAKGTCYSKLKKFNLAFKEIDKALKIDNNHPSVYLCRGYIYIELKDYLNAINDYSKTISLDSNFKQAYFQKVYCYHQLNDTKNELQSIEDILKVWPDEPSAINNLAWAYAVSNDVSIYDPDRAMKLALKLIKLKDRPANNLDTIAAAYASNEFFKEAVFYQELAIKKAEDEKMDKSSVDKYKNRLDLYKNKKQYRE